MPATSQKQEKFFNFVRAVQKGEASGKGYPKVEEAAKEMKPGSVEHFMGRGHIDKDLPKQAEFNFNKLMQKLKKRTDPDNIKKETTDMNTKEAFERGFVKAAMNNGLNLLQATTILKTAIDPSMYAPLIGAGIGGLGGALSGYDEDPRKSHMLRNSLIGAGAGAAGGWGLQKYMPGLFGGGAAPQPGSNSLDSYTSNPDSIEQEDVAGPMQQESSNPDPAAWPSPDAMKDLYQQENSSPLPSYLKPSQPYQEDNNLEPTAWSPPVHKQMPKPALQDSSTARVMGQGVKNMDAAAREAMFNIPARAALQGGKGLVDLHRKANSWMGNQGSQFLGGMMN